MANGIQINRITNANLYINGGNHLGKAEEFTMPVIKQVMTEHKAIGMHGKVEFPAGIDKMEAKIKWNSFYRDVLVLVANPDAALNMQCRTSMKTYTSAGVTDEVPVVIFVTGNAKDFPTGNFKQHDNVELESNFSVTYCKLVINGVTIVEIDVLANIYKVNDVDMLAKYRANLGI